MKQSLRADPESIRIPESVKIMRLSVLMRSGETHGFQALTHRLRSFLLTRRAKVHGSIMDSATPPQVFAQNDSIA